MHAFSHEPRPDVLDRLGLVSALELLTDELDSESGIKACTELVNSEKRLSPEAELVLFRIAQEALRNIRKHSQATEALVRIEFNSDKVKLTITDNGTGFELPEILGDLVGKGKLGLIGMKERVRLLDGTFSAESKPSQGTKVAVEIPA